MSSGQVNMIARRSLAQHEQSLQILRKHPITHDLVVIGRDCAESATKQLFHLDGNTTRAPRVSSRPSTEPTQHKRWKNTPGQPCEPRFQSAFLDRRGNEARRKPFAEANAAFQEGF